ncbi:cell surface spherulin 4-like protein [Tricladium varicosporioides]|nr:cell surface spherulin 4-like protein [Hymenoscyphus varicosporioides]
MFGRRKYALKASVLFPLYIYPTPGAWDPLFAAIESNPKVSFTVVTNPASGPGLNPYPDSNFTSGIQRLNHYPNVINVGYVSTNYTSRELTLALHDIHTYSQWAFNSTARGLGLDGIFLDEGVAEYDAKAVKYYETLAGAIRTEKGFGRNPVIIHNPGRLPDPRYLPSCTMSVVFEGTFQTYVDETMQKNITTYQKRWGVKREKLGCIVHSLPTNTTEKQERDIVTELKGVAANVFLTGLAEQYYERFWDGWNGFVNVMAGK